MMDARRSATDWLSWYLTERTLSLGALVRRHRDAILSDPGSHITAASDAGGLEALIKCVDASRVGSALGWTSERAAIPVERKKPFLQWRMETDDSIILSYLYRHHQPRRHLEFGTWEGFGTALCAESCDAEIWTINLPGGEKTEEGNLVYHRPFQPGEHVPRGAAPSEVIGTNIFYQTDSGPFIGWRYHAAGVSHRVHQILADSRTWDDTEFADGFFDSLLIDGAHRSDIVVSDTEKALRLLRSGGLMMWHDFCPVDEVMEKSAATRGVVNAIHAKWNAWAPSFKTAFWIWPSYLLVGIKR